MKKRQKNFIKINSVFLSPIIFFVGAFVLFFAVAEVKAEGEIAPIPGVDSDAKKAISAQALAAVGFEMAGAETVIEMPSSVAAVTCLANATTAALDVSGNLFSGKISKQSSDVVGDSLKSHFENFTLDNIISYDTELKWQADFSVDLNISIGSAAGPTVKNLECPASVTLWEAKEKRQPFVFPSFAEAINNANQEGEEDNKFIAAWAADSQGQEASEKLKEEAKTFKNRYVGMDVDFSRFKDPCEALVAMSKSSFKCSDLK